MKLITSKGNEYDVDWIDSATILDGNVILQMRDPRSLAVIAMEFDGLEWLKREDDHQGNKTFSGFNALIGIVLVSANKVQITLGRGGA